MWAQKIAVVRKRHEIYFSGKEMKKLTASLSTWCRKNRECKDGENIFFGNTWMKQSKNDENELARNKTKSNVEKTSTSESKNLSCM